ncbi:MAG: hypothetical protein IKC47_00970 [Clostridia bacterium]|nr:hypothetical protein [Clostridia bacterium]
MKKFTKATLTVVALLMAVVCLVACVPSNVDKAIEKFEKLDCYSMEKGALGNSELKAMAKTDEIEGTAQYARGFSDDGTVNLYYFQSAKDARLFFEGYVVRMRDTYRWENIDCKGKVVIFGSGKLVEEFI